MNRGPIAVLALLSLLATPALSQISSSGGGDTSAPGPYTTLAVYDAVVIAGTSYLPLRWNEPYNNTLNGDGTGTGSGGNASSRTFYYRTDHALTTAADYSEGQRFAHNLLTHLGATAA